MLVEPALGHPLDVAAGHSWHQGAKEEPAAANVDSEIVLGMHARSC